MFEDLAEIGGSHDAESVVNSLSSETSSVLTLSHMDSSKTNENSDIRWFNEMNRKRDEYSSRLKNKYGDVYEPEFIERIVDLYFGPFSLHPEILAHKTPEERQLSRAERHKQLVLSATIQHNLVHAFYRSGEPDASDGFVRGMYDIASFHEKISKTRSGHEMGLDSFWSGVKSELAIVKALKKHGYRVFLPDYTQNDWKAFPEDGLSSEVLQWDVHGHVDLVAENNGKIFLIDAKGRNIVRDASKRIHKITTPDIQIEEEYLRDRVNKLDKLPPTMVSLIDRLLPVTVDKCTITIPSGSNFLTPLAPSSHISQRGRDQMQNFAELKDTTAFENL